MGVVIHILERRTAWLDVAGTTQKIGTLRHLSKITELDGQRVVELKKAERVVSPAAVLVAQPVELPTVSDPEGPIAAHPVIGWDEGRGSVVDLSWDYLPVLGYAVWNTVLDMFVLHELRDGLLHRIDSTRARELGLLADGLLVRRGQPIISKCWEVKHCIPGFVEADVLFEDGRRDRLIVRIDGDTLPEPSWLVGRKPRDAERFSPEQTAIGGGSPPMANRAEQDRGLSSQ